MKTLSLIFDWPFTWDWLLTKQDKQKLRQLEYIVNEETKDAEQFLRRIHKIETETIVSEMEKL